MPESQADEPPIDVSSRPYLQGLPTRRPDRPTASGSAHLLAAATGQPARPVAEPTVQLVADVPIQFAVASDDMLEHSRQRPHRAPEPGAPRIDPEMSVSLPIGGEPVDYELVLSHVRALDLQGASAGRTREVFDIAAASQLPETTEEVAAWEQIERLVAAHVNQLVLQQGESRDWTPEQRAAHVQAVFDEAFRYGPLSPLLREDVENIDILGYDKVTVTLPSGRKEKRPPVTSSDEQLEEFIAKIASDRGRQFARPNGRIRLDLGGARFTALGGPLIVPRPRIAIRKHLLVDIDLEHLVRQGTLTTRMATFLTASMRAYASHLVSGFPETGKTTFLRALANALPPLEPIVTIETERELYLHKLTDRHNQVDSLQYLPDVNSGEDRTAAFSLNTAIEDALRLNAQVIFFGEILGPDEAASAIKALQAGKGASSTIHSSSAYAAIQRLSTALLHAGGFSDDTVPQRQIMEALNLIVQLDIVPLPDGTRRRVVSEISEIIRGDGSSGREQKPIVKPIFLWNEDGGFFEFAEEPSAMLARRLRRAGLKDSFFDERQA